MKNILIFTLVPFISKAIFAKEYHVSKQGDDNNLGTAFSPFATISKMATFEKSTDQAVAKFQ